MLDGWLVISWLPHRVWHELNALGLLECNRLVFEVIVGCLMILVVTQGFIRQLVQRVCQRLQLLLMLAYFAKLGGTFLF